MSQVDSAAKDAVQELLLLNDSSCCENLPSSFKSKLAPVELQQLAKTLEHPLFHVMPPEARLAKLAQASHAESQQSCLFSQPEVKLVSPVLHHASPWSTQLHHIHSPVLSAFRPRMDASTDLEAAEILSHRVAKPRPQANSHEQQAIMFDLRHRSEMEHQRCINQMLDACALGAAERSKHVESSFYLPPM